MSAVRLIEARLPDFGVPDEQPQLARDIYARRFDAFARALINAGLDAALVYADREHCANLAYLTGFDPRFEEALLIVVPGTTPTLLAGPENLGRAAASALEVEAVLYPPFGLMGARRRRSTPCCAPPASPPGNVSASPAGSILAPPRQRRPKSGSKPRPTSPIPCAPLPDPPARSSMPMPS